MKKIHSYTYTHVVAKYTQKRIAVVKDKLTNCNERTQAERRKNKKKKLF